MKSEILKDAKINLYLQLLRIVNLTENEVNIMYLLSKDEEIQEIGNVCCGSC